jgi:hypothetical protein
LSTFGKNLIICNIPDIFVSKPPAVTEKLKRHVSRTTLRKLLKQAGLSWKKCKKVLAKANPEHRAEFVAQFQAGLSKSTRVSSG